MISNRLLLLLLLLLFFFITHKAAHINHSKTQRWNKSTVILKYNKTVKSAMHSLRVGQWRSKCVKRAIVIDSSRPSYINYDLRQWWPTKRQDQAPLALRVISERANFVDCVVKTHIEMQSSIYWRVSTGWVTSSCGSLSRSADAMRGSTITECCGCRPVHTQQGSEATLRPSPAADRPVLPLNLCTRLSEWVIQQGLTSPSTHYRSFRRRVFSVTRLHWYWQPNNNNQETEHTNNAK